MRRAVAIPRQRSRIFPRTAAPGRSRVLDDHGRSRRDFLYLNYSHPQTGAPGADIRIGYARCSHLTQELQSQLDALAAYGIPRDKVFSEKISSRVPVRPQFEAALTLAREIKAHAPHCGVLFTVYEMKRLGRDAAELCARCVPMCQQDLLEWGFHDWDQLALLLVRSSALCHPSVLVTRVRR
ncbi:recombinase family protein [Streptomyces sp. NPDC090445]|uniref:recombinase family protein n=1 Tax=Streptomyces sp. NPDC090445 TaxID=3365963 RepID=UPI00380EA911